MASGRAPTRDAAAGRGAKRRQPVADPRAGDGGSSREHPARRDRRALACLVASSVVVAAALLLTLTHTAQRRTGSNGVWLSVPFAEVGETTPVCQRGELLPAGTSAIHLWVTPTTVPAPDVDVTLRRHGRPIAHTTASTSPEAGGVARIAQTPHDLDDVDVCFTVSESGSLALVGSRPPPHAGTTTVNGRSTGASMRIDYLGSQRESWLSHAATVVTRIGMGRGRWGGSWCAWTALALVLTAIGLAGWAIVRTVVDDAGPDAPDPGRGTSRRDAQRRLPTVAWIAAAAAILNAVAWSLITPAFQAPDEQTHVGYVQQLAEAGRPPVTRDREGLSPELRAIMGSVRFGLPGVRTFGVSVWSRPQQRRLDHDLAAGLSRRGSGDVGSANPEPPLYYAAESMPYRLASGATLLDRIALMRLLSALLAGATAAFAFLFVRELLPGRPWAWTVGALGVAFTPLLGFMSGAVNPDALLFALSAALFYCIARAFRRGLTARLAVWTGVVLGAGMLAKLNFYGLAPGAVAAVALAARVQEEAWNRRCLQLAGTTLIVGLAPYALLLLLDAFAWDRGLAAADPGSASTPHRDQSLPRLLSDLWQVFLPRLPGQHTAFPGVYPGYELWFKGIVGRFGWIVATFPAWVYRLAAALLAATGLLALRALVRERAVLRRRRAELAGYALVACGLILLIGVVAARGWGIGGIAGTTQGRYLLPLLALFGGALALAARGAGERWGRAVGVVIVVTSIAWTVFAQLTTIAFFYG